MSSEMMVQLARLFTSHALLHFQKYRLSLISAIWIARNGSAFVCVPQRWEIRGAKEALLAVDQGTRTVSETAEYGDQSPGMVSIVVGR